MLSIVATSISIALTFGTVAIIDSYKKEKEKREIAGRADQICGFRPEGRGVAEDSEGHRDLRCDTGAEASSDYELQREAMEKFGERYPGMGLNDWCHIIETYTPMVRETTRPDTKELSMSQYDKAAESSL